MRILFVSSEQQIFLFFPRPVSASPRLSMVTALRRGCYHRVCVRVRARERVGVHLLS